ncbi:MAG: cyclic lactone autoinducer peptide [Firmicutes bacterium]|nr:cyclic lactone autoinducer peptide [Bacillota bacterium]
MKKLGASLVVLLCTTISMLYICAACWWSVYQPVLPQKPRRNSVSQ